MNRLTRKFGALLCLFGFHEWQKWRTVALPRPAIPQPGTEQTLAEAMMETGRIRERRCKWCGRVERREFMKRVTTKAAE